MDSPVEAKSLAQHDDGEGEGEDRRAEEDGAGVAQGNVLDGHEDAQQETSSCGQSGKLIDESSSTPRAPHPRRPWSRCEA